MGGMGGGMGGRGAAKSDEVLLKPNTEVQVCGLKSARQHNGKEGKIITFDSQKKRYTVMLETQDQLGLRGENLRQIGVNALVGQTSDASLSNAPCQVVGFDLSSGRYHIRCSNRTLALRLEKLLLQPGTVVRLHGLVGGAQHNDKYGKVQSFDSGAGRYEVEISSSLKLRVKPDNLSL